MREKKRNKESINIVSPKILRKLWQDSIIVIIVMTKVYHGECWGELSGQKV